MKRFGIVQQPFREAMLTNLKMAWAVGTYIATSGGIIAALLAIVSEIQKPAERFT